MPPRAISVVVPTRNRADTSRWRWPRSAPRRATCAYEVVVVDDGSSDDTGAVAGAAGVRVVRPIRGAGLNAARNAGVAATSGALVAFVDDDVWVPPGWLARAGRGRRGATRRPMPSAARSACASRGRRRAAAGARRRRSRRWTSATRTARPTGCGARTSPCGARRSSGWAASTRQRPIHGDEEEWLLGLRAGRAASCLPGRRRARPPPRRRRRAAALADARRLVPARPRRAAQRRAPRRGARPAAASCATWPGAGWHAVRRACPQGLVMGAHSAGRLRRRRCGRGERAARPPEFLSGESGRSWARGCGPAPAGRRRR